MLFLNQVLMIISIILTNDDKIEPNEESKDENKPALAFNAVSSYGDFDNEDYDPANNE